jgi:hypothetical protein
MAGMPPRGVRALRRRMAMGLVAPLFSVAAAALCLGNPAEVGILPIPQEANLLPGSFRLDGGVVIAVPAQPAPNDVSAARRAAAELADRYGTALRTVRTDTLPHGPFIAIGTAANPLIQQAERSMPILAGAARPGAEGYFLFIRPGAVIVDGSDDAGAFYGWQSLRQLLARAGKPLDLPAVRIRDWPSKPIRGIKIYLPSRDQIGFYRRFVSDFMALYKFNFLMVEIDGAMRFDRHPGINAGWVDMYKDLQYTRRLFPRGPRGESEDSPNQDVADGQVLEKREVAEIADWARQEHVQFVPEMPSLTHSYYLLTRHRELADPTERTWEWPDAYNADNPAAGRLYFDCLDEVIEATHPSLIHIGHDEWQVLLGDAPGTTSQDRRRQYAADVRATHDYLARRGIRISLYGDELIEGLRGHGHNPHPATKTSPAYDWPGALPPEMVAKEIPKDILIFNWFFQEGLPGKGEKNEILLDRMGFKQVFSCNSGPNMAEYGRRAARAGILGTVPASWAATNEFNFGKDLMVNFLGWDNCAWSSHYPPLAALIDRIEDELPLIRQRLSGKLLPSEEGDQMESFRLPDQAPAPEAGMSEVGTPLRGVRLLVVGVQGVKLKHGVDPEDPMAGANAEIVPGKESLPLASPPIPIHADVSSLIFLHALARPAADEDAYESIYSYEDSADLMGCYEIAYEDGYVTTVPIRYGWNILESSWGRHEKPDSYPLPTPVTYAAREVKVGGETFFAFEWPNPRLGRRIASVRLLGAKGFHSVARNSHGTDNNEIILRAVSGVLPRKFPGAQRAKAAP